MPRKKPLRYRLFMELMMADDEWFDGTCKYSTGAHDEEYFDYLAKKAVSMMKKDEDL